MNFFRCPICLLIPRIISANYHMNKFTIKFLCENNHTKNIEYKDLKKFCLKEIKCNECQDINNESKYYCKTCFNVICENCTKFHQERKNHNNLTNINIIDDICLIHEENIISYCHNCEESICNTCLKLEKHKGHKINELKLLDLKDLKDKILEYKKNLSENIEKYNLVDLISERNTNNFTLKHFNNRNEIIIYVKELKDKILDIIDFILNMISDFEQYKKEKNKGNYTLYLNSELISNFISLHYTQLDCETFDDKTWFCKNYVIYKSRLLQNEIKDNEFFFNKNLISKEILRMYDVVYPNKIGTIGYCNYYQNENQDNIIIYLDKNKLIHKNIETMDIIKQIEINDINIKLINNMNINFLVHCKKEYLLIYNFLGSFEVFVIYDNKSKKIYSFITEEDQQGQTFDSKFQFCRLSYSNNKIYVTSFYQNELNIYNILTNKLESKIHFKNEIIYGKYFLDNIKKRNIYDFLLVATEEEGYIYELKTFSQKKKLCLKNIYCVLLTEIYNKNCFIISYDYNLIIMDFISNEILFQTTAGKTKCLFLWNKNTIIENYSIDSCANVIIIDLFDKEKKYVFEQQDDFWWTEELLRIKSKKYGDCLLRIGLEKINLYYIKPEEENKNNNDIKKKDEPEKNYEKFNIDEMIEFDCPNMFD